MYVTLPSTAEKTKDSGEATNWSLEIERWKSLLVFLDTSFFESIERAENYYTSKDQCTVTWCTINGIDVLRVEEGSAYFTSSAKVFFEANGQLYTISAVSLDSTELRAFNQVVNTLRKGAATPTPTPPPSPLRIPGDVNDDSVVNIMDALLTLQYSVGWDVEINLLNADVDASDTVTIMDALLILQYSVGWDIDLL